MPISFNPLGDLSCCDGLEAVTLQSPAGLPRGVVPGALRRHVEQHEAEPSDGLYTAQDVTWHLPAEQLASLPEVGSVITDGTGRRYIVLTIEQSTLNARWQCRSRNLAIVGGLNQRITLQQASWTKDASGAQVPTWQDVQINLAARIQPQQAEINIEYDRRLTRVTHNVFVANEVFVDHTYRVVAGADIYRVLGFQRSERIDALFTILVAQTSGALA
ncbi:MAG TPA: head-tail adaptor protein [Pirellulales bacterium]|jgi:head-tail adaptor